MPEQSLGVGRPLNIESANPINYFQALHGSRDMARCVIDGRLYLPATTPAPVVIVVPGSLGVAPSHLRHAATFVELGFAACVIDPFGRRGVTSTVANQTQYSFAASAYDVLATVRMLATLPEIDPNRIGAQGHSRGGTAVITAAMRRFAQPILGATRPLRAVYAAYPWCGHQFLDPDVGDTRLRAVIGDRDEWCLPAQVQAQIHAIRLRGGQASMKLFGGAIHSFDRGTAIEQIADAAVAPSAPIIYLANDGAMVHPLHNAPDPTLRDYDTFVYGLKAGYGRRGAGIGSKEDDAQRFHADMVAFWTQALRP